MLKSVCVVCMLKSVCVVCMLKSVCVHVCVPKGSRNYNFIAFFYFPPLAIEMCVFQVPLWRGGLLPREIQLNSSEHWRPKTNLLRDAVRTLTFCQKMILQYSSSFQREEGNSQIQICKTGSRLLLFFLSV